VTVPELERRLAELLRATGADHHAAFAAADGDDPEWPLWYAQHMRERAAALLGAPLTVSDLVHWLVQSERDRAASAPDAAWPEYYAAALAARVRVAPDPADSAGPTMYGALASWWPILSTPADYAEEAEFYRRLLVEACDPRTVLELGSGGGNNASHMKRHFQLTLVDRSPQMLAVSAALNPECEHIEGDMRDVRLGRTFDAVFVHDAVMYMATAGDLARAIETAFVHCRPGGAALFAPDYVRETFAPRSDHGGHDDPDGRSLRYLGWDQDPDPDDETFAVDYAIMLRAGNAPVRVVHDRHTCGLFSRARWIALCRAAGFEAEIRTVVHSELAPAETDVILCRKPGA
jgi:SAM-dependent methyltransferase